MNPVNKSNLFYQTKLRRPALAEAKGIYMWDMDGKRYIDGSSGAMVCNIGHSNENVLAAMRKQMEKATFGYRLHFETEVSETLAAKTAALAPIGLEKVFFVSGGSEAVESAIKLARQYAVATGQHQRWKVISRYPSYHGGTLGALTLTGYAPMTAPFSPMLTPMPKIPAPRAYLDKLPIEDEATGIYYANMLEQKILEEGPDTILAFIVEPIGGASTGALVPPAGYMQRIREICSEYDVLLIHDEVMTGGGRTGKFFGAEHWDVKPDILAISKGFAAGFAPLGAMVADEWLVEPVLESGGFIHGFTYAGNPLACSAGVAVLDEIERLNLIANAETSGNQLKRALFKLKDKYPFIGDVRGKGLLLAFELVSDPETLKPLDKSMNAFSQLVEIAYEKGLIIYSRRTRGGYEGDHFLVCPPMITDSKQVEEITSILDDSLKLFATKNNLPMNVGM